jgi:predicted nucleotidyltransferase
MLTETKRMSFVESQDNLRRISETLTAEDCIISGRVYGSFLNKNSSEDLDLAVMIPSDGGVVEKTVYERLLHLRSQLCKTLTLDVDLIPHTEDEVHERSSPLWNPRYHPSLRFGVDVKDEFPVPGRINEMQNPSIYVLHDNRTITRRQLLRQNTSENWRIFIAKLIHGPGNILTYLALKNGSEYLANPSDIGETFRIFDQIYESDSHSVITQFSEAKSLIKEGRFTSEQAVKLLNWYESLLGTVLGYNREALYSYLSADKPELTPESATS